MRKTLITLVLVLAIPFVACGGSSEEEPQEEPEVESACAEGCQATVAANCDVGPASQAECMSDCEGFESGDCATEYSVLQRCSEGKSVSCSAQGVPTVNGCESAQNAFVACLIGG